METSDMNTNPEKGSTLPTREQIVAEIEALENLKPRIRRFSAFGDDNWERIDAELWVLRECDALTDEDDICDEYDIDDDYDNFSAACSALAWLKGEWNEKEQQAKSPSEGWAGLIQDEPEFKSEGEK
jgi:hypothetical protein